ncbi:MAG: hypothetical protein ACTHMS_11935 [Jatrophihabitans sp.]|uniref:hypothetical protein n=1 Tax=Jatrophihabitans sp. TaxID=1932789 RepID=UPI003F7FE38B
MSELRFRDRLSLLAWLMTVYFSAFAIAGVAGLAIGVSHDSVGDIAVGLLLILLAAPVLLLAISQLRARVLTDRTLTIPTFVRHRVIDLAEVATVALLRQRGRRTAWFLVIWTAGGDKIPVGIATPTKLGKRWRDELTGDHLATSRAGRSAVAIWQRARALQGEIGPLDRTPIIDRLSYAPTTSAYWTPATGAAVMPSRAVSG